MGLPQLVDRGGMDGHNQPSLALYSHSRPELAADGNSANGPLDYLRLHIRLAIYTMTIFLDDPRLKSHAGNTFLLIGRQGIMADWTPP